GHPAKERVRQPHGSPLRHPRGSGTQRNIACHWRYPAHNLSTAVNSWYARKRKTNQRNDLQRPCRHHEVRPPTTPTALITSTESAAVPARTDPPAATPHSAP